LQQLQERQPGEQQQWDQAQLPFLSRRSSGIKRNLNLTLLNETPPVEVEPSSEAAGPSNVTPESLDKMKIMVSGGRPKKHTFRPAKEKKAPESGLVA
jgi:hypothetical protein